MLLLTLTQKLHILIENIWPSFEVNFTFNSAGLFQKLFCLALQLKSLKNKGSKTEIESLEKVIVKLFQGILVGFQVILCSHKNDL